MQEVQLIYAQSNDPILMPYVLVSITSPKLKNGRRSISMRQSDQMSSGPLSCRETKTHLFCKFCAFSEALFMCLEQILVWHVFIEQQYAIIFVHGQFKLILQHLNVDDDVVSTGFT